MRIKPTTKGERTREQLLERAAGLFNRLGYRGASLSDVMQATGLKKGGIYRHFESKEALALEAFDFAVDKLRERFTQALAGQVSAPSRLRAIFGVYARLPLDPPVPGGCPILNAAVEADDAHPALRARAEQVMTSLKRTLRATLRNGVHRGELRADIDVEETAVVLIALLEGAVMLSKLYGSQAPARHVNRHLEAWLQQLTVT